jgi:hypothetical protein
MLSKPIPLDPELAELLEKAQAKMDAMSPEEKEAMFEEQKRGYVAAEMSWPAPKFKWVDGVKVYDSYDDYVNG